MTIKLVDLDWQHNLLKDELALAFHTVVNSSRFILGPQIRQLEENFAKYHHCQYGIGVSSGTDALVVALKALNLEPGDEVIVPAMTFYATAEAVCLVGATPVIVDVEPETLALDPSLTEAAITERTKVILPVHLHGWPVPLEPFLAIAQQYDLSIVEDCAQAHGAKEKGYPVGSRTIAGCFSFFPGKNMGALGDAGMVITNDPIMADTVRALANHGRKEKYFHEAIGYNARIDELQAAFLNIKLNHIEQWNEQRRALANRYNEQLSDLPLQLPPQWNDHRFACFHLYVVHCRTSELRDNLINFLKEHNIQSGIHYPVPLHLQPGLKFLGNERGDFPISEQAANTIISLPIYPGMSLQQQDYVIEKVTKFFRHG